MIRIVFKRGTDKRVTAAMKTRGTQLAEALRLALDKLMLELQARIQRKLSGEVLKSHSGGRGLLGSVHKMPTVRVGGEIRGSVQAAGGDAWYGRVHEFGGTRTYEILPGAVTGKSDKLALAFFPQGSEGAGSLRLVGRRLFFKMGARRGTLRPGAKEQFTELGGVVVRKVIHPPLPKRPFMSTALDEMRSEITAKIFKAAADAVRP